MITFLNNSNEEPYVKFRKKYDEAYLSNQKLIEAIAISSFSKDSDEVDSRFVNLKFVDSKEFIFFSNYESNKAKQFESHKQISVAIHWHNTNTQIRMKGEVNKTSKNFNKEYFSRRSEKKNALAISSNQSKIISSYEEVKQNYKKTLDTANLYECPEYWGGYSFVPYNFEFWVGNDSRINFRESYDLIDQQWKLNILEP